MINVNGIYIVNNQRNANGPSPIIISLKKYDYFPGEFVEGNVILQLITPMVMNDIYLNLTISEFWNVRTDTVVAETSDKVVLSQRVGIGNILKINSTLINLNPGRFNFPFKFKLQENFPPIFEYPKNDQRGHLRYILKAQIYSSFNQGEANVYLFIKTTPRTLQSPLSFSVPINLKKVGMNNGTTVLKTSFKQNYYPIRGKIPIEVEVDNSQGKSKVKGINIKLVRRVQYKKVQESKYRYNLETIIASYANQIDVPPKTKSQIYHFEILIKDDTMKSFNYLTYSSNPYPKLTDLFYTMPSINSYSIKCNYFVVASLEFAGLVSQAEPNKTIMPIFLYHLPIKQNEPKIIENQFNNSKQNNINNNLINSNSNVTINEVNLGAALLNNQPQQNYNIIENEIHQNQAMNPQQNINVKQNEIYQNEIGNAQQNYKIIENEIHQNSMINPQQKSNIIQNQIRQNQVINPQQNNNIVENQIHQNQVIHPQQSNNIIQNEKKQERIGQNNIDNDDNNEFNLLDNVNEENKMIIATTVLNLSEKNINKEDENNQKILSKKKMKKIEFISNDNNNNIQSKINDRSDIVNIKKKNQKGHIIFTLFDY